MRGVHRFRRTLVVSGAIAVVLFQTIPAGAALIPGPVAGATGKAMFVGRSVTPDITIAVDNTPPPGKLWEYNEFFPNHGIVVHPGEVVDFHLDPGDPNGAHTIWFGPATGAFPALGPDPDAGTADAQVVNPNTTTHATCGFALETPCLVLDTTTVINSGILNNSLSSAPAGGWDFEVRIDPGAPSGTYGFQDVLHPFMTGTLAVDPTTPETTQAQLDTAGLAQYQADNAAAGAAEAANQGISPPQAIGGVRTWTVKVGLTVGQVDELEYFPARIAIAPGDAVRFDTSADTQEVHTVTFAGQPVYAIGSQFAPYLSGVCEGATTDPPAAAVPGPFADLGCQPPSNFEQPFNFNPSSISPITISSSSTLATSGGLTNLPTSPNNYQVAAPFGPLPTAFTFDFASNGRELFYDKFEANMTGNVATSGYRLFASDGGVFNFGHVTPYGSLGGTHLNKPIVAGADTSDAGGYWEVASDGGVFTLGDAQFHGSMGATHLNKPIVGMAATPDGTGYWLVASDGGLFTFGDANFLGSTGGVPLNKPVVGMAPTPDGQGYWLVASDGGIFSFGDAKFYGSMGATHLNKPIVGMAATPDGKGYWLVASDGGVFTFGDAAFDGSMGGTPLNAPIVGIHPSFDGNGYRLVASDGGLFNFGDAGFFGSAGGIRLNAPVVGSSGY